MNRLIELWQELASRERLLLMVLAAVLLVGLSYQMVWSPLSEAIDVEKQRRTALQQSLLRIENIMQQLPAHSVEQPAATHDDANLSPLVALIDALLKQSELNIETVRIQALTTDIVELEFEKVAFDNLIPWLATLEQEQAVLVAEIILQQNEKIGMVKAKINLARE